MEQSTSQAPRHLSRQQIDASRWDVCVGPRLYAQSWYLDALGHWSGALVWGDYHSVWPLFVRPSRYLAWPALRHPPFAQQLGLFGQGAADARFFEAGLAALPRWHAQQYVQANAQNPALEPKGWQAERRRNQVLDLRPGVEALRAAYGKSLRKRLRQAPPVELRREALSPEALLELYGDSLREKLRLSAWQRSAILRLVPACRQHAAGSGIYSVHLSDGGELLAAGFFPLAFGRLYNLFGASTAAGRAASGMALLLDGLVAQYAGQDVWLDFEGSSIPGVAQFFASFGATDEYYMAYKRGF